MTVKEQLKLEIEYLNEDYLDLLFKIIQQFPRQPIPQDADQLSAEKITAQLNDVYASQPSTIEPALMQMQVTAISADEEDSW